MFAILSHSSRHTSDSDYLEQGQKFETWHTDTAALLRFSGVVKMNLIKIYDITYSM